LISNNYLIASELNEISQNPATVVLFFMMIISAFVYMKQSRSCKIVKQNNKELEETKHDLLETNLELQRTREELLETNKELIISKEILQETNEELKTAQKTFKNLLYGTSEPILLIYEDKFISCNDAVLKLLGYKKKWEILNLSPVDISPKVQPDGHLSSEKSQKMINMCVENGNHKFQWVYSKSDGDTFWCEVNLTNITMDHRDMIHATWRDITKEKQLQEELEKLAVTDKLTKVYNRHKVDEALDTAKELMDRYHTPFGVIMLDIDHFKNINDTYGHVVGDSVLVEFASILASNSRKSDTVGRVGGEEFLIIVPHATELSLMSFAKKLHDEIREYEFSTVGKLTASIGVSMYQESESIDILSSRVDKALYQSKENGRDRITFG
jgi:diguanylate cyclase (GGDEF)-like protein/PAS domain S-box-containing protein